MIYLLTPIDVQMVILLQNNRMYPTTLDSFFECLDILDKSTENKESVLKHSSEIHYSIKGYYKHHLDKIPVILKNII